MTTRAKATAHTAYVRQKAENIQAIINEYKGRRKMTNADIVKALGKSRTTVMRCKSKPGSFRIEDLWLIFDLLEVPDEDRKTIV